MTFHFPAIIPEPVDDRIRDKPSVRIIAKLSGESAINYNGLTPDVANEARASADRIKQCIRRSVIDVGRELVRMKDVIPHGDFMPWVGSELRMTQRTAQRYMSVVTAFEGKCDSVSYLPPTTLFSLSSKSTPPGARIDLLKRIAAGGRPGEGEVADILRCHKPPKKPVQDDPAADATPPTPVAAELEREAERLARDLVYLLGEAAVDLTNFLLAGGGVHLGKSLEWALATAAKRDERSDSLLLIDAPADPGNDDTQTDRSPPGLH